MIDLKQVWKITKKACAVKENNKLSIEQIEHLWSQRGVKGNEIEYAPKGIDPLTLAKIKSIC